MPTLDFKGKQFVYAHHLTVPFRQLNVDGKKSIPKDGKASLDDNLIIHGDNLHALKALLPKYAGKVKCIYIDPPYNTGNEGWCYSDNINAPLIKEWLKDSANPVDREDLERHDKWLCMMWPRLQLLRELLAEEGTIFVSIDDNELHHLRATMDEIFGADNFVTMFVWRKVDSPNDNKVPITPDHELILCYAKDADLADFAQLVAPSILEAYSGKDDKGRYYRDRLLKKNGKNSLRRDRPTMFFPIVDPDGNEILPIHDNGEEACWAAGLSAVKEHIKNKTLIWKKRKKQGKACWEPYTREYAPESPTRPYPTIWSDLPTMRQAKAMLRDIFATTDLFSTPKPVELISRILDLSTNKDSIVLDSYAGSGTTAQAVLAQNRKDGGSRKFIMVETEDYADKLTAERVRRVIKGVNDSKDEDLKKGLGGVFTFCELGDEINIENLLKGDKLPSYDELARYAFYTATGQTLDKVKHGADFFVGETANYRVHVIYQPDTHFLRSQESALNMPLAERISKAFSDAKKTALVFATHKFMGQKELSEMRITYCQLPYAIHRVVGD